MMTRRMGEVFIGEDWVIVSAAARPLGLPVRSLPSRVNLPRRVIPTGPELSPWLVEEPRLRLGGGFASES